MSSWRGNPNIPSNRARFRSDRVPYSSGRQNLAGIAVAGDSNPITSPAAFCTSTLNAMHETSAPQAAPSSSMGCAAEQHAAPSTQPFWNLPSRCTQVPINIIVFHRRLTGRGSRPQISLSRTCTPAPALPAVSEDGTSIQLAGSNFLSLGRASNIAAGHMSMNPSQIATPDTSKSEHAPIHLQPNGLDAEASKTGNETVATQLQQSATTNYCDSHTTLESAVPANTLEAQGQHSQEPSGLLGKGSAHDNIHIYQSTPKRSKRQISRNEHTPLSSPAIFKEKTLSQIEMQIEGAEKTETFRNEESPTQKLKTRRKKHRPKVIREDRKAKLQKPVDSTPDGRSPNLKVKRSYVRKKRTVSSLEKCSRSVSNQSISGGRGIAARRTASVRRSLHFGLEEQRVQEQEDHIWTANSHHHNVEKLVHDQSSFCSVTESEVQDGQGLQVDQSSFCSVTESEVQVGQGPQVDMENSPGGLALDMSLKLNKMLDEYIHLPAVTPEAAQEVSIATSEYFGKELAREQDSTVRAQEAYDTSKKRLRIEEKVDMTVAERSKTNLESNHFIPGDFSFSGRSVPDMEPTSQKNKVSKIETRPPHNNDELSLSGAPESIILRTAARGIKKKRSSRIPRNSFVSVMNLQNNSSPASTRLPQPYMNALCDSSYTKFVTRKRSQKVRPQCPSFIEPNLELNNRLSAGSISYGELNGLKISDETFHKSSPWTVDNQTCGLNIRWKAPEESSTSVSTVTYSDYLQEVSSKLQQLDLNTEKVHRTQMSLSLGEPAVISFGGIYGMSNALVPYGDGVVVPYERPLQIVKRQRPRAKVDLDFETTRVWNLLMGSKVEPVDGTDVEKEKWWKQEREVFEGRANSFIARMQLVQGDRRFSPWKGSVVDSVVGVFLTQNVADHLSSSAYMALAATFPARSVNNSKDSSTNQDNGQTTDTSGLEGKSTLDLFHNCVRPNLMLNCEEQSVNYEKTHMEPNHNASVNELIRGEMYSFDYKTENASVFSQQGAGMEQKVHQTSDFCSVELTTSSEVLREMQFQSEISFSQSVTLRTRQSRLLLSSGTSRNFVVGGSVAAYQHLQNNLNHGKSLTGNGTITSEIECQRLETVAINGDDVDEPETSSSTMPFCSTIDSQHLDLRNEPIISSTSPNSFSGSAPPYIKSSKDKKDNTLFIRCDSHVAERCDNKIASAALNCPKTSTWPAVENDKKTGFEAPDLQELETVAEPTRKEDECTLKSDFTSYSGVHDTQAQASRTKKTKTTSKKNTENFDWDKLRRQVCREGHAKERSFERRDSVDWEAVRCADVQKISHAIRERGMNNILAERIQNFLNRLVRDHGSIDLEWLRDIPPDSAKDFLLSIRGLGLKSVECVRLLTLHHLAFPVDTNVGRICVRLGWVPIQPLPESLQLHLLELYPVLETIQKYLWPRLCKLDQQTLYELHYHMITFGKVFCTKSKPNCNACPLRSECKHFASAFASARLALPAPQDNSLVKSSDQHHFQSSSMQPLSLSHLPRLEGNIHARDFIPMNTEPIIEEPTSPKEEECPEILKIIEDIEDFDEDGEIPTIKLNMEAFAQNLENCIKESNKELQSDDIAKALVSISSEAASIPLPKLKNVHRLRTEHYVYELPDSHPLVYQLELDQRELDDPSPYLLAIWTPGEIKEKSNAPKPCCSSQGEGSLCNYEMCHDCTAERQNQSRYVRGTILVPCRTAMRGSFPLNGTYFQVNEVFADHKSSHNPINVERKQIWSLQRRMVFFGTSVPTIFKGLTTEEIQQCFWRGFVCVRGFDREFRAPRPLCPHLHVVARPKNRKMPGTEQVH